MVHVPRVKDNNPLGTQKTVPLDFDESRLVRASKETLKFQNWSHFTNSRRRYMAENYQYCEKLYPICQTINQSLYLTNLAMMSRDFFVLEARVCGRYLLLICLVSMFPVVKQRSYCKCITFGDVFFLAPLAVVSIRQIKYIAKCASI